MQTSKPFNLLGWVQEHRHLLKPPVGNQTIYTGNKDFIVMVVGGPNARKDYHINLGEELFYQLEGTIEVGLKALDGTFSSVSLSPGDMMLVPACQPHQPRRPAGTVGLVLERYRLPSELDSFVWFCENCQAQLHKADIPVADIVTDLPLVLNAFWESVEKRTCKSCGTYMEKPNQA